jgi:putative transposase
MSLDYKHTYRKNLPHIQPPGATFFVTFRLAGTLPLHVVENLRQEAELREKQIEQTANPTERDRLLHEERKRQFGRYDMLLDSCAHGPTWLKQSEIAQTVQASIHFLDQKMYDLDTYTIMSNHVHLNFTPLKDENGGYIALQRITYSLKRFTATKANKILQRRGQFWQHESYDHIVRDEAELQRIRRYILLNPVKAGLVEDERDWPYSWAKWWTDP